jgi:hypothetical protein
MLPVNFRCHRGGTTPLQNNSNAGAVTTRDTARPVSTGTYRHRSGECPAPNENYYLPNTTRTSDKSTKSPNGVNCLLAWLPCVGGISAFG